MTNDKRVWTHIGGDLEASYDGSRYVDIRTVGSDKMDLFLSKGTAEALLRLFPENVKVK